MVNFLRTCWSQSQRGAPVVGKIVVRNKRLFRECEIPDSFLTTKGAVLRLATFVKGQLLELQNPLFKLSQNHRSQSHRKEKKGTSVMISNMWLVMLVLTLGVLLRPSPCSALDAFAFELFLVEEAAFDVLETYPARGTPIVLV